MTRRPLAALLAALAAALLVAGCASIPDAGPVRAGQDTGVALEDAPVRVLPPVPRPGATPEDVVRGFLLASASAAEDRAAARAYLAPDVSQRWRPDEGARVYESRSLQVTANGPSVSVTAEQVASIGPDGRYAPSARPTPLRTAFEVERVQGEWRIARLQDGLLHTTFDVRRTYRPLSVHFLAPDGRTVVPDLVVLPTGPGLATVLAQRVLAGPSGWLAPAVRTAVPAGTTLAVSSVPVVDGVAQVDLSDEAYAATSQERQALSAQLVWTLRQLDEVRSVRLTVEGGAYPVAGVAGEQSRDSWPGYDPSALPEDTDVAVVRDGRLGLLDGTSWAPAPGEAGTGDVPLVEPALSLGADVVAALAPGRDVLLRGPLAPDGRLEPVLRGTDLADPSWDRWGTLWTVERSTGALRVVAPDGTPVPVAVQEGLRPLAVRVARDGARAVLVQRAGGRDRLVLATVVRGQDGTPSRVAGATEVLPDVVRVRDVAWVDAARVAVLGDVPGEGTQVRVVDVTGWASVPSGPVDAVSVAAAPDRPLLAGTADGQVVQAAGRTWTAVGPGQWPAYPG